MLAQYFNFETTILKFSHLNKYCNSLAKGGVDIIWKQYFKEEFEKLDFDDFPRQNQETYFSFFKRAFQYLKYIRKLVKGIIDMTRDYK